MEPHCRGIEGNSADARRKSSEWKGTAKERSRIEVY